MTKPKQARCNKVTKRGVRSTSNTNKEDTMNQPYSEYDTEQARQREKSAQNMPVPTPPAYPGYQMPVQPQPFEQGRRKNALAIALIGVGALMLSGRVLPNFDAIQPGIILLTISSCFFFFSFWQRIFGLMIPGAILAGLGIGVPLAELTNGVSVLWGLAAAFIAIAVLGRGMFRVNSSWATIPASILFVIGAVVLVANLPGMFMLGGLAFPALLVGLGLWLGWGRRVTH